MSPMQTLEREKLNSAIMELDEEAYCNVASYVSYLVARQRAEDAEDIADCEARKGEPSEPIEDVLKELGLDG